MNKRDWSNDELLTHLLNKKSGRNRWDNISILRSRLSEELFLKCIYLVKSKNNSGRILGIDILAQFGTTPRPFLKQSIKLYFHLLEKETNAQVLMSVLYAIGHNNDKLNNVQIEKLCSFSNTSDKLIKEGLVFALLGVDKLNAIQALIVLSSDRSSHIRDWATFGIGSMTDRDNKKIREALWARVNEKHQDTKLEAIVGLANRKDDRIKEIIKRELLHGEYGTLLFNAITETGDKQYLPLLRQNLKMGKATQRINTEWLTDLRKCIASLK